MQALDEAGARGERLTQVSHVIAIIWKRSGHHKHCKAKQHFVLKRHTQAMNNLIEAHFWPPLNKIKLSKRHTFYVSGKCRAERAPSTIKRIALSPIQVLTKGLQNQI